MIKRFSLILFVCMLVMLPLNAYAIEPIIKLPTTPTGPTVPSLPGQIGTPKIGSIDLKQIIVAFTPNYLRFDVSNTVQDVDLNMDRKADLTVASSSVTGKNGAKIYMTDLYSSSMNSYNYVPSSGYADTAAKQFDRLYIIKFTDGSYAKLSIVAEPSRKLLLCSLGKPAISVLKGEGSEGCAVLRWDALPDAKLGYNVYRYKMILNSTFSIHKLNDLPIEETTFTDNTTEEMDNSYIVYAVKSDGLDGTATSTCEARVYTLSRTMKITPNSTTIYLDDETVDLETAPEIKNGRVMVPLSLFSSAGAIVDYDASTGSVTMAREGSNSSYRLELSRGLKEYTAGGTTHSFDVVPYEENGEVFVQLYKVGGYLGYFTVFDSVNREAIIQWFE